MKRSTPAIEPSLKSYPPILYDLAVYSDHFSSAENTTRAVLTYATRVGLNENKSEDLSGRCSTTELTAQNEFDYAVRRESSQVTEG